MMLLLLLLLLSMTNQQWWHPRTERTTWWWRWGWWCYFRTTNPTKNDKTMIVVLYDHGNDETISVTTIPTLSRPWRNRSCETRSSPFATYWQRQQQYLSPYILQQDNRGELFMYTIKSHNTDSYLGEWIVLWKDDVSHYEYNLFSIHLHHRHSHFVKSFISLWHFNGRYKGRVIVDGGGRSSNIISSNITTSNSYYYY